MSVVARRQHLRKWWLRGGPVEGVASRSRTLLVAAVCVGGQASRGAARRRRGWSSRVPVLSASGWCGERFELGEGGGEFAGPGPVGWEAQGGDAGVEGQAGGDAQQPVAQALGLGASEFAGQEQALGPGDQGRAPGGRAPATRGCARSRGRAGCAARCPCRCGCGPRRERGRGARVRSRRPGRPGR